MDLIHISYNVSKVSTMNSKKILDNCDNMTDQKPNKQKQTKLVAAQLPQKVTDHSNRKKNKRKKSCRFPNPVVFCSWCDKKL